MKHFTAKKSCHFSTVEIETKFEQAYVYLILLDGKYSLKITLISEMSTQYKCWVSCLLDKLKSELELDSRLLLTQIYKSHCIF